MYAAPRPPPAAENSMYAAARPPPAAEVPIYATTRPPPAAEAPMSAAAGEAVSGGVLAGIVVIFGAAGSSVFARGLQLVEVAEDASFPDPDELAQEIADDLRSALGQIEDILGDLGQRRKALTAPAPIARGKRKK